MRKNNKLACGALAVNIVSGILGLVYLMSFFSGNGFSLTTLGILAGIMTLSTFVMVLALPKRNL